MTAALAPVPYVTAPASVTSAVNRMKSQAMGRDEAMEKLRKVREGKFADVWPDQFSSEYPTSLVSNFVDVSVRDLASEISPLPSLMCAAGRMKTDADKKRAMTKNRIGFSYWLHSDLEYQMKFGVDQYLSYAFLPFWVEADYDAKQPFIHVDDPAGSYYELDRRFKTKRYAKIWRQNIDELAAQFPEYETRILIDPQTRKRYETSDTEVVRFIDDTNVTLYLPDRSGMVIAQYRHRMPYCPVHIAIRPGLSMSPRGMFDDVLWVQLAASVMAALTLEAGHKAVQAPLAVPSDMNEMNIGPDSLIVTDNPEKVQRVPLSVPAAAFELSQQLKEEMREGAGYPGTRLGQPGQANVTGRGISALEGGFDSQIKLGQDVIGRGLREATKMAFEMDVTLWPNKPKKIDGTISGESFSITYTPSRDIGDNYQCQISYGFGTGTNPQAAIVTMLQLRGDELISRDTVRRQLPFDVDIDQEQRMVDIQMIEDGLKQGMAAALQASGQMIAQGQAAEAMQFFQAASKIIKGRREGEEMADLIVAVFEQQQAAQQQQAQEEMAEQQQGGDPNDPTGGGGDPLAGVGPNGLPQGVAPGQAGMPPGGRPSVTDLTASFGPSGNPTMGAAVRRRVPTG